MRIYANIIDDSPHEIWGLTSRQRKIRVLKKVGITDIVEDIAAIPADSSILLFRGDYLFDDRVINYLVQTPQMLLSIAQGATRVIVAAHITSEQA